MPDITEELDLIASLESPTETGPTEEDIEKLLLTIYQQIEKDELPTRELLLRQWKYYLLLWQGIMSVYWNSVANEWQPMGGDQVLPNDITVDPSIYNKVANIIRPYGESIAGALSSAVPKVHYLPYNAEDPADINTAKTFSKIEKLVTSHNNAEQLLLQALLTWYKFGFVAAWNYPHQDADFGTVDKQETIDKQYNVTDEICAECGSVISSNREAVDDMENVEIDSTELLPDNVTEIKMGSEATCPNCGSVGQTQMITSQETEQEQVTVEYNKFRQIIKVFGPLEVKIPARAKSIEQVLWLIYEDEYHVAELKCLYPDKADKISAGSSSMNAYERYIRSNWEEYYENLTFYATMDRVWLRPEAYYLLPKEEAESLKAKYPNGVMFTVQANNILEIKEEKLDDHWTLTVSPGDNRILADAGCKSTVPMQVLTNEILQMQVECFKYSIPTAFADPEYLDFTAYSQSMKQPGLIYPMKSPPNGQPMTNLIAELRTSVYPKDAADLDAKVEKLGQFTSGALPSIWGGPSAGSQTLGEYEQQRNQALQRIGLPWKMIKKWWSLLMAKCIKGYIKNMMADEYHVQKHGESFINVWIRKSELTGKVGDIVPDISEQFPSTWAQTSAKMMELIGMQNEMVNGILAHPNNTGLIARTIGVPELYIPGEDQRNKEFLAIAIVLKTEPEIDPATGQPAIDPATGMPVPIMAPPVNPLIDDINLQMPVLKAFLASDVGVDLESSNPPAYQALVMRLLQMQQIQMQQMLAMQQQGPPVETPPEQ